MNESTLLLGNLLVAADILKPDDLTKALNISHVNKLPIGKVLLMSEFITEQELKLALDAQEKASSFKLTPNHVVKLLKFAFKNNLTIDEAFQKQTARISQAIPESTLPTTARLLIASLILHKNEVDKALETSSQANLPFGRVLINTNKISVATLSKCLAIQFLIKDNKITWNKALAILRQAHEQNLPLSQVLDEKSNQPVANSPFKLGDILIKANLIEEVNFLEGLELSLINQNLVGSELVKLGFIDNLTLEKTLEAQNLIRSDGIDEELLFKALKLAIDKNISVADGLNKLTKEVRVSQSMLASSENKNDNSNKPQTDFSNLPLYQFIQLSGLVSASQMHDAIKQACLDTNILIEILKKTNLLDNYSTEVVRDCYQLLSHNKIKCEQAIIALNYCLRARLKFREALNELNIKT